MREPAKSFQDLIEWQEAHASLEECRCCLILADDLGYWEKRPLRGTGRGDRPPPKRLTPRYSNF
jgi:hypothetical protein